jgi:hypothetical protein
MHPNAVLCRSGAIKYLQIRVNFIHVVAVNNEDATHLHANM